MRCPNCQIESPVERHRCAVCQADFDTYDIEELGHLAYLEEWLQESYEQHLLSARRRDVLLLRANARAALLNATARINPPPAATVPEAAQDRNAEVVVVQAPPPVHQPPREEPTRLAKPRPEPRSRPSLSWAQIGTYLLSERTLHALLGLGALLILASG